MRKLLLVFWWTILAATAHAADLKIVHLHLTHPCTVVVQQSPAPNEHTTPVTWSDVPTSRIDVHIDIQGDHYVTGTGPLDFFRRYELPTAPMSLRFGDTVTLQPNIVPIVSHLVAAVGGAVAALLGCAVALVLWGGRQRQALATRQRDINAQHVATGLFPADGSLPRIIPPYRVISKLGSGGMAVVYEVENDDGERFALKMPYPHLLQDAKYLRRFTREAKIGLRLRHPNLVSLLSVNDDANVECPYPYLVMELVNGTTLDRILDDTRCPPQDQVIAIIQDVLTGLNVVHNHGIVHRDIKPGNIMVMTTGRARLMDFGVAHKQETHGGKLTGTEEILGTPRYMAPEQIQGRSLDGRCDTYAVGIMLYEMLAGTVPYGTDDTYTILGLKCTMPLPPLATQGPVSVELGALVDRMVAIDVDDRPASIAEIQAALAACPYNRETTA